MGLFIIGMGAAVLIVYALVLAYLGTHDHQWTEVSRKFTDPVKTGTIKNSTEELFRDLAFGFTTIELKCSCGAVQHQKVSGHHID